jgi:hypothetical protein
MNKSLGYFILLISCIFLFSCNKELQPDKIGSLTILDTTSLVLQPGPETGQDCLVAYRDTDDSLYAKSNHHLNPDVTAIRWSYDADAAGNGTNRTYIKFTDISNIPSDATVLEARLSLFGVESGVAAPIGNSFYPGSPYELFGENEAWLKRVTADWTDSTITWLNKPQTTDDDQASIAASNTQWNYNAEDIDVTNMVKAMVSEGKNYGFCLQLKTEELYRSILFGSSEATNESKRPKLEVKYSVKVQ